jgi:hypothetical protein
MALGLFFTLCPAGTHYSRAAFIWILERAIPTILIEFPSARPWLAPAGGTSVEMVR